MLSSRVKKLKPYVPGEQPKDKKLIKLNTNESPFPPSPKIEAFLKNFDIDRLRRYPDPTIFDLRKKIADKHRLKTSQVFIGNGSDEVLSFVFFAFFDEKNGPLLFPEFTYSFYPVYCDFYDVGYKKIPLAKDFSVAIDRFLAEKESCGIIFPNPNAPTGVCLPIAEVEMLMDNYASDRVVAIDEAYIEFGGTSAMDLVDRYENLLIVRTFSKSKALAGLRIGYAVGSETLIDALFTVKDSFNSYPVGLIAQSIGAIAFEDDAYYKKIIDAIIQIRKTVSEELELLGWEVLPSSANFVFARLPGVSGDEIYKIFREKGIIVRHFNTDGISDFIRITIGDKADMERFIEEAALISSLHE